MPGISTLDFFHIIYHAVTTTNRLHAFTRQTEIQLGFNASFNTRELNRQDDHGSGKSEKNHLFFSAE